VEVSPVWLSVDVATEPAGVYAGKFAVTSVVETPIEPPTWPSVCASPIGENRTADPLTPAVAAADIVIVVPEIAEIVVPNGTFG
jgi:hypothetical protein